MATGLDPALGYLLDLVTDERFEFQFNPSELTVKLGAEWTAKSPRGSSHPRQHYGHSKGRGFSLELHFLRTTTDGADIETKRRAIEALAFPDYDSDGRLANGPHPIRVGFGPWRTFRCVVEDVEIGFNGWFDPETLQPGEFTAKLTFVEQPEAGDLSRDDVLGGA